MKADRDSGGPKQAELAHVAKGVFRRWYGDEIDLCDAEASFHGFLVGAGEALLALAMLPCRTLASRKHRPRLRGQLADLARAARAVPDLPRGRHSRIRLLKERIDHGIATLARWIALGQRLRQASVLARAVGAVRGGRVEKALRDALGDFARDIDPEGPPGRFGRSLRDLRAFVGDADRAPDGAGSAGRGRRAVLASLGRKYLVPWYDDRATDAEVRQAFYGFLLDNRDLLMRLMSLRCRCLALPANAPRIDALIEDIRQSTRHVPDVLSAGDARLRILKERVLALAEDLGKSIAMGRRLRTASAMVRAMTVIPDRGLREGLCELVADVNRAVGPTQPPCKFQRAFRELKQIADRLTFRYGVA